MRQHFFILFMVLMGFGVSAQVGINNPNPHGSAALDVTSTTQGFLPPRMTATQRDAITSPASGLIVFCADCGGYGEAQIYNGTSWTNMIGGAASIAVTSVTNPTTGEIWMDRNLGASQVATSSTGYLAYGSLFQWGRLADGHEIINWTSSTGSDGAEQSNETSTLCPQDTPGHGNFILASSSPYDWRSPQYGYLWQGVNGINNPCPSGYRLPTEAEWEAERQSWGSNNAAGAYASPLKLPMAGFRDASNGSLGTVGSSGRYWSGTVDGIYSRYLYFYSSNAYMLSYSRAYGFSVRCLKD